MAVTPISWPNDMEGSERALQNFVARSNPAVSPGSPTSVRSPNPERPHGSIELLCAQSLGHPHHADVARFRDDVLEGQGRKDVVVVYSNTANLDESIPAVDHFEGRDHAFLERRRRGDDLEDAARFVGIGDGPVHPVSLGEAREFVWIERRQTRHGQHFARPRIQHHRHPRDGSGVTNRLAEGGLRDVLDAFVDGERDLPALGGRFFGFAHRAPSRIEPHADPSGAALEVLVEGVLKTRHALVVPADVTQNRGQEVPFRVIPSALRLETDAFKMQVTHPARDLRIDLALDPDKRAVLFKESGEFLLFGGRVAEGPAKRARRLVRLAHGRGIGVDAGSVDRDGERPLVTVHDRSPPGLDGEGPIGLVLCFFQVEPVPEHLQVEELGHDDEGPHRAAHCGKVETKVVVAPYPRS